MSILIRSLAMAATSSCAFGLLWPLAGAFSVIWPSSHYVADLAPLGCGGNLARLNPWWLRLAALA